MNDSVNETRQSILAQLQGQKPLLSRFSLIFAVLVIMGLCFALSWNMKRQQTSFSWKTQSYDSNAPKLVPLPTVAGGSSSVIAVRPGIDEQDDLFLCASDPITTCVNLTQSPSVQETWPVINNSGSLLTYYGISGEYVEIYLQPLPDGLGAPLTIRSGYSGLHVEYEVAPILPAVFSPDERWLAFPAFSESKKMTTLFIAETSGQVILPVQNWVGNVVDYRWIDNQTLVAAITYSNGELDYKKIHYHSGSFYLGELP